MKKFLLSIAMLVAVAVSASADEPTYTAKGTVGTVAEGWESYPAVITGLDDVDVEVYASDSIIIRKWCGVDDYDLVVGLGSGSDVSDIYCWYYSESAQKKITYSWGGNSYYYVYTGLTEGSTPYAIYFNAYTGYSQYEKDDDAKTGSLILYVYTTYNNDDTSSTGAYYINWKPAETEGITSIAAAPAEKDVPIYNLSGQRVSSDAKGLLIKNGKKVLVK